MINKLNNIPGLHQSNLNVEAAMLKFQQKSQSQLPQKIFVETYGCQMNEYDTELIRAILTKENFSFVNAESDADVVMLNTCSVREGANLKIYNRIHEIKRAAKDREI